MTPIKKKIEKKTRQTKENSCLPALLKNVVDDNQRFFFFFGEGDNGCQGIWNRKIRDMETTMYLILNAEPKFTDHKFWWRHSNP